MNLPDGQPGMAVVGRYTIQLEEQGRRQGSWIWGSALGRVFLKADAFNFRLTRKELEAYAAQQQQRLEGDSQMAAKLNRLKSFVNTEYVAENSLRGSLSVASRNRMASTHLTLSRRFDSPRFGSQSSNTELQPRKNPLSPRL